ncbi:Nitroimidazol reductase NimA, pyridoxamine 5'-phosphate oxidase superfamily, partial [Sinosporangium album]
TRLASALSVPPDELLGGSVERPPGSGPRCGTGEPVLEMLDRADCLRLIAPGGVGRVGFNDQGGPTVLPVNYVLHDGAVYFRTAFGGPLDRGLRTGVEGLAFKIAFEVDRIDDVNREGWSVLVRGGAHLVAEEERDAVATLGVRPWAGGDRQLYVRVDAGEITGRRIRVCA